MPPGSLSRTPKPKQIKIAHFINVDLEIASRSKLDVLAVELGALMFEMFRGREGGLYRAHYETNATMKTPDAAIRALVHQIDKLSPAGKKAWRGAARREFNIGVQAAHEPRHIEQPIERTTVEAVARLGARIVFTVYAPEIVVASRPRTKKLR